MDDFPKLMRDSVVTMMDAKGVYPYPAFALHADGHLDCLMFDLPPKQVFGEIKKLLHKGCTEIIFGLDRSTKPGQGTKYDDVFVCSYFKDGEWKVGVINYIPPKDGQETVVDDWDWDNEWWQAAARGELDGALANTKIITKLQMATLMKNVIDVQTRKDHAANRPEIAQELLAKWDREYVEAETDMMDAVLPSSREFQEELFISGCWLGRELKSNGCEPSEARDKICEVHGQRCMGKNPWDVARQVLENYKQGIIETPGAALADKIMFELAQETGVER